MIVICICILIILCFYYAFNRRQRTKEHFTSKEIYEKSNDIFENGDVSYSLYKESFKGADPILYMDVRKLWRGGNLTIEEIEKINK
jgi:hypothetical protein